MSSKSTPTLESLPPEVLSMIVAPLRASQLDGISRTSKRIREVVQQHVFKAVSFSGVQDKVLDMLRGLIQDGGASNMDGIRRSIRRATIKLPRQLYYWENASYNGIQGIEDIQAIEAFRSWQRCDLPREIVKAVKMMPRLSAISLDLWHFSRMQKEDFRDYLGNSPKWSTVEDLGIDAESTVYEAVFSQCVPGKVTSLRLQRSAFSLQYLAARRHFPKLKRLQLSFFRRGTDEPPSTEPLENLTIRLACRDFPELEWLVVTEKKMMPEAPYHYSMYRPITPHEVDRHLMVVEGSLKRLPRIRRFAMTLWRETFIHIIVSQQAHLQGRRVAGGVEDEWYFSAVRRIAKAVPALEQIVIISMHHVFYRGTRVVDGDEMTVEKGETEWGWKPGFPQGSS